MAGGLPAACVSAGKRQGDSFCPLLHKRCFEAFNNIRIFRRNVVELGGILLKIKEPCAGSFPLVVRLRLLGAEQIDHRS